MFRAQCAHRQEVKIVLYSIWYQHTKTSEWSKITKVAKITKIYKYEHIVAKFYYHIRKINTNFTTMCPYLHILVILAILVILDHSLVSVC
jgi:hypothetical protein